MASLATALGVRAWGLDAQSLWYDEGISVALAQRDLLTIARSAAADIHPPLYYYLLHLWVPLAGNSEYAVRWLSVALGTLLVPLVYRIGRRLHGVEAGLLGALFVALNPILVYYSQEARMYILMTVLGAAATYLALRVLHDARPSGRLWLAYTLVAVLTAYSHYYGLTVLLALSGYAAVVIALRKGRRAVPWLAANGVVVLAFLPWVRLSWDQLRGWPAISQPLDAPALINKVYLAFSFGFAPPTDAWPSIVLAALLAGALFLAASNARSIIHLSLPDGDERAAPPRVGAHGRAPLPDAESVPHPDPLPRGEGTPRLTSPRLGVLLAGLLAAMPVLALYLASLQRPMYNPKFLLAALPGYLLLLALGAAGWMRLLGWLLRKIAGIDGRLLSVAAASVGVAAAVGVALPAAQAVVAQATDPRLARDDYRGIVRYIDASWREGDAILLNAPGQVEIFAYYHPDLSAVYPLPQERPPDEARTVAALQQMSSRHRRIWAVLWAAQQADPQGIVEHWLDANAYKSLGRWYGGVRLALYTVPGAEARALQPLDQRLGDDITLVGYSLESDRVQPGEVLGVNLYWRTEAPIAERYKVFVQLLDPQEYLWGQHDSEPAGGSRPTLSWQPGEQVADRHGLLVPPGTPPGRYDLIAGLYHPATGQRLSVASDPYHNRVYLGSVVVERPAIPPTIEMLHPQHTTGLPIGADLVLLGYDLFRYGTDSAELHAGEPILLNLYWQARRSPAADYDLELILKDAQGRPFQPWRGQPTNGNYPTSRWQVGEVVRDQHRLEANMPGEYTIAVSIKRGEAVLGAVEIGKMVVH
ncbi:MAG: glycosyltransferase family 39 protein [Chloroflexi bacterium]|nr:glycosyltransferase family 39 protein [Chloroflexota bacterium]